MLVICMSRCAAGNAAHLIVTARPPVSSNFRGHEGGEIAAEAFDTYAG
jgi:hypothetical protein